MARRCIASRCFGAATLSTGRGHELSDEFCRNSAKSYPRSKVVLSRPGTLKLVISELTNYIAVKYKDLIKLNILEILLIY